MKIMNDFTVQEVQVWTVVCLVAGILYGIFLSYMIAEFLFAGLVFGVQVWFTLWTGMKIHSLGKTRRRHNA